MDFFIKLSKNQMIYWINNLLFFNTNKTIRSNHIADTLKLRIESINKTLKLIIRLKQ